MTTTEPPKRFPYLTPPLPPCPRCGVELTVTDWINGIHTAGCGQQIPISVY